MTSLTDGTFVIHDVVRGRWTPGMADKTNAQTAAVDGRAVKIREAQEPGASGKSVIANHKVMAGYDYDGRPATGAKTTRWRPLAALGLALEPLLQIGVGGDVFGQDFDGDGAVQAGVASLVDLALAARAEGGLDLVGTEGGAGSERHGVPDWRRPA